MAEIVLEDLIDEIERHGGGLSGDEPAMNWPIFVADHHQTSLMPEAVEVLTTLDGSRIIVRLRPEFKIELVDG